MKKILIFLLGLVCLMMLAWQIIPSQNFIAKKINQQVSGAGIRLEFNAIKFYPWFRFSCSRVVLVDEAKAWLNEPLAISALEGYFNVFSGLVHLQALVADGLVSAKYSLLKNEIQLKFSAIELEKIKTNYFSRGQLSGELFRQSLKFKIENLRPTFLSLSLLKFNNSHSDALSAYGVLSFVSLQEAGLEISFDSVDESAVVKGKIKDKKISAIIESVSSAGQRQQRSLEF